MKINLSERVRPNCEAAPWVIDEIKLMEANLYKLHIQNEKLKTLIQRVSNFLDESSPEITDPITSSRALILSSICDLTLYIHKEKSDERIR
jgi:hypothetical protein